ncbi:MAG: hypothetical protein ACI9FR_002190 [Cryomorphaceae bacterium]|jgi:hypothetical protein
MNNLLNTFRASMPSAAVVLILFGLLSVSTAQAQPPALQQPILQQIGEVALSKGVTTARSEMRPLSALAKGSPVYLGDIIETASRSFLVIKFSDGGKVTLRPDSRFDLNEYDATPGQEKESFELLKGGLRAVTGAIGKSRPEQVKYTARNTTIGIRGTTLVIKLCDPGVDGCQVTQGASGQSGIADVESTNKYVDIFIVDKSGGKRSRVTREELQDLLQGVYVSVIEGAIQIDTPKWSLNMSAGDKCLVDYSGANSSVLQSNKGVECFIRGQGVEDIDVYLGDEAEDISVFNLFDNSELSVGGAICEIN